MKDPAEGGFPSPATLCGPRQTDYPSLVDPTPPTARSKPTHHQFLSDYPAPTVPGPADYSAPATPAPLIPDYPSHPCPYQPQTTTQPEPTHLPNDFPNQARTALAAPHLSDYPSDPGPIPTDYPVPSKPISPLPTTRPDPGTSPVNSTTRPK